MCQKMYVYKFISSWPQEWQVLRGRWKIYIPSLIVMNHMVWEWSVKKEGKKKSRKKKAKNTDWGVGWMNLDHSYYLGNPWQYWYLWYGCSELIPYNKLLWTYFLCTLYFVWHWCRATNLGCNLAWAIKSVSYDVFIISSFNLIVCPTILIKLCFLIICWSEDY